MTYTATASVSNAVLDECLSRAPLSPAGFLLRVENRGFMFLEKNKMRIFAFIILFLCPIYAMSATYYVKNGGNDSSSGTSDATAWATINKVNTFSFTAGDDVYLKVDNTWNEALDVDWSGTGAAEGSRVIIGAYHMNAGTETRGVPSGSSKPRLVGNYPIVGGTAGAIPSGAYRGLVFVTSSYVLVENLRVENSSGASMLADGTPEAPISYITFSNNEADGAAGNLIQAKRDTSYVFILNNTMRGCAEAYTDGQWVGPNHPNCSGFVGSSYGIMEGNYIYEGDGEAIVSFAPGSHSNIIRKNIVAANRWTAIYIDASYDNIVEDNMVLGTDDSAYYAGAPGYSANAFQINVEYHASTQDATGNVYRNNVAAGIYTCFRATMQPGSRTAGRLLDFQFIGNTCINTYFPLDIASVLSAAYTNASAVKNNIFHTYVNEPGCATNSDISYTNNHWDTTPTDTDCAGSNGQTGDPLLVRSNWIGVGQNNLPVINDFTPLAGSNALLNGTPLTNALSGSWLQSGDTTSGVLDTTELTYDYDYTNTRHVTTPTIGAVEVSGTASSNITLTHYEEFGLGSNVVGSVTWLAQSHVASTGYYNKTVADTITGGGADEAMYQSWIGCNCTIQLEFPTAETSVDFTAYFVENYWASSGNRLFDIYAEGNLLLANYDIYADAGGQFVATSKTFGPISVSDGSLTILLVPGTGATDPKPQITGIKINTPAANMTVGTASGDITRVNRYPEVTNIDAISACDVSSTVGDITITSITTTGLTSGAAVIADTNDLIEYTPVDASSTGSVGSITAVTFSDGTNTDTCDIALTLQFNKYVKFKVKDGAGSLITSTTGWSWTAFKIGQNSPIIESTQEFRGAVGDEQTDADGYMDIYDDRFIQDETYLIWVFNPALKKHFATYKSARQD